MLGVGLRNGGIQGMGAEGVHVTGSLALDRVFASGNGGDAFRVSDSGANFSDPIASFSGGDGFVLDDNFPAHVHRVTSTCPG